MGKMVLIKVASDVQYYGFHSQEGYSVDFTQFTWVLKELPNF